MIDAALENATAVSMSGYLDAVSSHCIVDELVVLWLEGVETLLNDMIAVEILDEGDDVAVEGRDESGNLARCREMVNESLDRASSVTGHERK